MFVLFIFFGLVCGLYMILPNLTEYMAWMLGYTNQVNNLIEKMYVFILFTQENV